MNVENKALEQDISGFGDDIESPRKSVLRDEQMQQVSKQIDELYVINKTLIDKYIDSYWLIHMPAHYTVAETQSQVRSLIASLLEKDYQHEATIKELEVTREKREKAKPDMESTEDMVDS